MDICRALPENATIELYQDKQQVVLRSQRSRFTLSTLPAEDYPNTEQHIRAFTSQNQFSMNYYIYYNTLILRWRNKMYVII